MKPVRVLLVTHPDIAYSPTRYDHELVVGLGDLVDLTIVHWELLTDVSAQAAGADLASFDVCMVYIRFRFLLEASSWDWTGFTGPRIWMEHDAWGNYSEAHPQWQGSFPHVYQRDHRYRFNTRAQVRRAIFAWINRYNSRRRQSTLSYIAPIAWEQTYHQPKANPVA